MSKLFDVVVLLIAWAAVMKWVVFPIGGDLQRHAAMVCVGVAVGYCIGKQIWPDKEEEDG